MSNTEAEGTAIPGRREAVRPGKQEDTLAAPLEAWTSARRKLDFSEELARKGWYHSFRLPDGRCFDGHSSLSELHRRLSRMPVPTELSGKRVLDIGAWDGWFSFEMERRGAKVVAVDCVDVKNFRYIHEALGSQVEYHVTDFYEVSSREFGRFDIVLFLGVLYHLKHPLLALEKVCALSADLAIVSSFITDDCTRPVQELLAEVPRLEFYETDELGGHLDNWYGPNLSCLMALCRAAGFARVEFVEINGPSATVACYRKWPPPPHHHSRPVRLLAAVHTRNWGVNFSSRAEEYLSCWFESDAASINLDEVRPDVGGYGVRCLYLQKQAGTTWQANFRLPPGLEAGWYSVRLRVGNSGPSNSHSIAVDLPLRVGRLRIHGICDAVSSEPNVIRLSPGVPPAVCIWVLDLPENADRNNVKVVLGNVELAVKSVSPSTEETVQVNAIVPEVPPSGVYPLAVSVGGVTSEAVAVQILKPR